MEEPKIQKFLAGSGRDLSTLHSRQAIKAQITCDEAIRLGVDVVSEIIKESADGGLAWVQSTLENDLIRLHNIDCPGAIMYALSTSPLFAYIVWKCRQIRAKNERVLVVVNSLCIMARSMFVLRKCGFKANLLRV
ncbi:hypothetical protein QBC43DRAFT_333916 [Cladorrhinum sp. PSN259]|nr:hypothetical protein QBC43DRAFT_333916 [Cladorrhinum sp. PSN259]